MNTASYALLTFILLAVIYLPQIGNETPNIRKAVCGTLIMNRFNDNFQVLDLSSKPTKLQKTEELGPRISPLASDETKVTDFLPLSDGQIIGMMPHKTLHLQYIDGSWNKNYVDLPDRLSDPVGMSPDGRLICCTLDDRQVIYNLKSKKKLRNLNKYMDRIDQAAFSFDNQYAAIAHRYEASLGNNTTTSAVQSRLVDLKTGSVTPLQDTWHFTFSPVNAQLAWATKNTIVIYNCLNGHHRSIKVPGSIDFEEIEWSPDGRFIAYLGHPNWFTAQNWWTNARVINVKTGKSATLYRDIWTAGAPSRLFWIK